MLTPKGDDFGIGIFSNSKDLIYFNKLFKIILSDRTYYLLDIKYRRFFKNYLNGYLIYINCIQIGNTFLQPFC